MFRGLLAGDAVEVDRGRGLLHRAGRAALAAVDAGALLPGVPTVIVEPGVRTGVQLAIDNPKEVGSDRVVNTLAAYTLYGGPSIVVDFGTTTNFDVVSARGEFLGGVFAPGIEISFDALAARAAQLRKVEPARPRSVIGKNTVECLQSGMFYGFAGQVDRIVRADDRGAGRRSTAVIATGGLAPWCWRVHHGHAPRADAHAARAAADLRKEHSGLSATRLRRKHARDRSHRRQMHCPTSTARSGARRCL